MRRVQISRALRDASISCPRGRCRASFLPFCLTFLGLPSSGACRGTSQCRVPQSPTPRRKVSRLPAQSMRWMHEITNPESEQAPAASKVPSVIKEG